jgi:hypothetical protein
LAWLSFGKHYNLLAVAFLRSRTNGKGRTRPAPCEPKDLLFQTAIAAAILWNVELATLKVST